MTKKILISFLYLLPISALFFITETYSEQLSYSMSMGFISHYCTIISAIIIFFIITRIALNKLFNKITKSNKIDYVTTPSALPPILIGYLLLSGALLIILISPDSTEYGRWLRGARELSIVKEIKNKKSNRENEYIEDALVIAKKTNTKIYNILVEEKEELSAYQNK